MQIPVMCFKKPTFFPKLVIYAPPLRVCEDLVSLCDLLEPVLCIRITVLVGVELEGQLPVGLLDLILVGLRRDAQHFVEVLAGGLGGQARRVGLRLAALLQKQEEPDMRLAPSSHHS